jgi:hypothetical protein
VQLDSPLEAFAAFFAAANSSNWSALALTIDPLTLTEFQQRWIGSLEAACKAAGHSEVDVWLPADLGAGSIAELRALAPEILFARYISARMPQQRQEAVPQRTIVGVINETDDLAHILYRHSQKDKHAAVAVMSMRRVEGRWQIIPGDDITFFSDIGATAWRSLPAFEG